MTMRTKFVDLYETLLFYEVCDFELMRTGEFVEYNGKLYIIYSKIWCVGKPEHKIKLDLKR